MVCRVRGVIAVIYRRDWGRSQNVVIKGGWVSSYKGMRSVRNPIGLLRSLPVHDLSWQKSGCFRKHLIISPFECSNTNEDESYQHSGFEKDPERRPDMCWYPWIQDAELRSVRVVYLTEKFIIRNVPDDIKDIHDADEQAIPS